MDADACHENLKRLNGRRFDQADLTKLGFSSDTVINYERKYGLLLCSPPPGRGRPRKFCLLDVYLLEIVAEILAMTGSLSYAVQGANQLLLDDFEGGIAREPHDDDFECMKSVFEEDVYQAPDHFSERTCVYYIYTSSIDDGFCLSDPYEKFDPTGIRHKVWGGRRMLYFNLTQLFADVDLKLIRLLEERYGQEGF